MKYDIDEVFRIPNTVKNESLRSLIIKEYKKEFAIPENNGVNIFEVTEWAKDRDFDLNVNTRTAQILMNDDWQDISPIDIKKGMIFRMFESSGERVIGLGDSIQWEAEDDAYFNDDGIITVRANG